MPSLENALEIGFSKLNAGEEELSMADDLIEKNEETHNKPEYGLKINVEENRSSFIAKPIKATKKIDDKPLELNNDIIAEEVEVISEKKVLDSPSSKIGDDFAVDW